MKDVSSIETSRMQPRTEVEDNLGHHLKVYRNRCGLTIRDLAEKARVSPAVISSIERGKSSPTVATLQNIVEALGLNMATFFNGSIGQQEGPVYLREHMKVLSGADRSCTVIFPKTKEIRFEMLDEILMPGKPSPPFSVFQADVAGYLISGELALELRDQPKRILRVGDAFYIPKGVEHRGYSVGEESARVITVW
jgi:transcriptional regulator with XRE-family HTH domain